MSQAIPLINVSHPPPADRRPHRFRLRRRRGGITVALGIFGVNPSSDAGGWIILFAAWTAAYAGAFAFMPWLIAVVFAEGFGLRSVWFWFASAARSARRLCLTGFYGDKADGGSGIAIHLAAGFVGGFVYG